MKKSSINTTRLDSLIEVTNPYDVLIEIKYILSMIYDTDDCIFFENVFDDIVKLYKGKYRGYKKCSTYYHDLNHTLSALMAMARLIHGFSFKEGNLSKKNVLLGLISALMHDTGYIQTADDISGTGAKFTLVHISRSIEFMEKYFKNLNLPETDIEFCKKCISCTNINTDISTIAFSSEEEEIIGKMLGLTDLLGQMADRSYLEKLFLLYIEFVEGDVKIFESELDLLNQTIGFFDFTQKRFTEDLGNLDNYMIYHFKERWNVPEDLYMKSIEGNIKYLRKVMNKPANAIYSHLRRDGILDELQQKGLLPYKKKQKNVN